MSTHITLISVRRDSDNNLNQQLQWIGNSLGLFNLRDKDSSCFRIFITLVKKARRNEIITSDDIAIKLDLSRGTVVHHLTKLQEAGIVVHEKKGYLLRESSLANMIHDLKRDMEGVFAELDSVAKEIDERIS